MPISKTPKISVYPVWATEEKECDGKKVERYAPLPTAESFKTTMLFGIPLTSSLTGQTLSDEAIQGFINEGISEVEHTLDLYITPVQFTEKHDYIRENFTWNYNYTKLNHPNVFEVEAVELSFTNDNNVKGFVNFPLEHVHLMPTEGVIQLVPAFGTSLSGFLLSAFSGTQFHALRAIGVNNFPGGVRVRYTSGFDCNKVPAVLVGLINTIAAIRALSVLGPVLFPHNSVSISIDGTSQSTGTLGPAFLNNRLDQLEKQKETQMAAAKTYYQRNFITDWF